MPAYIEFHCPCGRTLRVKHELAGTVVRCWDCHAEHAVPSRKEPGKLARETYSQARGVLEGKTLLWITLWTLAACAMLLAPSVGVILALVPLTTAGMGLRAAVRGGSWRDEGELSLVPIASGLAIGLVLAAPLIVRHGLADSLGTPLPSPGLTELLVAIVCWVIAPAIIALCCARNHRAAILAYARHPVAILLLILFVPLCLVALEGAMLAVTSSAGWLKRFVADLMPQPDEAQWSRVLTRSVPLHPEALSIDEILYDYRHALTVGYTLCGSLLSSIPRGPRTRIFPFGDWFVTFVYMAGRLVFASIILLVVGVVFMVQARGFGLIARADQLPGPREPEQAPVNGPS